MFHVPEELRIRDHPTLGSDTSYGNNGAFRILYHGKVLQCIASDGEGWEHVSVTIAGSRRTPSWNEMSYIKNLFWDKEDCVIQYHPPESEYVNNHPGCLHLWRPINVKIPNPPKIFV